MRSLALAVVVISMTACVERALPINGNGALPPDLKSADLPAVNDLPAQTPDSFAQLDQGMLVDLKGILCSSQTCNPASEECCVSPATGAGACTAKGACNRDMSAVLTCDGPEDCPGAMPNCCASFGGAGAGQAACSATCVGAATVLSNGGFNAVSKLCHGKGDCVGYSGTVAFGGTQTLPFSGCCELPQAPGFHFCAPSLVTMIGGTCQ